MFREVLMGVFIICVFVLAFTVFLLKHKEDGSMGNCQNQSSWNIIRLKPNYTRINSSYISDGLRSVAKVITFEETYQQEVPFDKVSFFVFHDRMRVVYAGKITGGFDLSKARLVERNGRVEIELPDPEIFSNEILKRYTLQCDSCFTEEDRNRLEEKGKRMYEEKVYRELTGDRSMERVRGVISRIISNTGAIPSYSFDRSVPTSFEVIDKAIPITKNYVEKETVVVDGSFREVPERLMCSGSRRLDYDSRYGSGVGRLTYDSRDDDTYRRR